MKSIVSMQACYNIIRPIFVRISTKADWNLQKNKGWINDIKTYSFPHKFLSSVIIINPIRYQGKFKNMSSNEIAMRY